MSGQILGMGPRHLATRLILLGGMMTVMLTIYTYSAPYFTYKFQWGDLLRGHQRTRGTCSPQGYASGRWTHRPLNTTKTMTKADDVLEFAGFQGCASSREYYWHLGADRPAAWDRFPGAMEWEWTPGEGCEDMRPLRPTELVRDMVEKGGWLLIGDSVTENHFFSLSCLLFPHVRATPNYTENPYFDRAWPQNLYLEPSSPLVSTLRLPPGFSVEDTPLVTFRRVDLLLSKEELEAMYVAEYPDAEKPLFSDEQTWSLSPSEYMDIFMTPLPKGGYSTAVLSTAGHWTTTLMSAFRQEDKPEELYGIQGVLKFFRPAMGRLASYVQARMDAYYLGTHDDMETPSSTTQKQHKSVVVRAYLPGHEDCHDWHAPWTEVHPMRWNWYNWASIGDFNKIFEGVLSSPKFPDVHFLPIDMPAQLRPDAHSASDCLHIMTGAGVLEGWTHYIWHYVTRELPGKIR